MVDKAKRISVSQKPSNDQGTLSLASHPQLTDLPGGTSSPVGTMQKNTVMVDTPHTERSFSRQNSMSKTNRRRTASRKGSVSNLLGRKGSVKNLEDGLAQILLAPTAVTVVGGFLASLKGNKMNQETSVSSSESSGIDFGNAKWSVRTRAICWVVGLGNVSVSV